MQGYDICYFWQKFIKVYDVRGIKMQISLV